MVSFQRHERNSEHHTLAIGLLIQIDLQFILHMLFKFRWNPVNWKFSFVVFSLTVCTFQQKSFYVTTSVLHINSADGDVKRRLAKDILSLQVRTHREQVVQSHFRSCVARPVKRSTHFRVSNINIDASAIEIVKTQSLIFLSSQVHGSRSKIVPHFHISSSFLNQKSQHRVIAILRSKMESCVVLTHWSVNPLLEFLSPDLNGLCLIDVVLPGVLKNDFEAIRVSFIGRKI